MIQLSFLIICITLQNDTNYEFISTIYIENNFI